MIRHLPARERVATPWRNGGGQTREVCVCPEDASLEDFDWRISMADVDKPGPFSVFEDIERTLCILRGAMRLEIQNKSVSLDETSAGFAFAGDTPVFATPVGGDVLDFNVMVRKGRAKVQIFRTPHDWILLPEGGTVLMLATVSQEFAGFALGEFDALMGQSQDFAGTSFTSLQGLVVAFEFFP
jgi:environmental stress-induced protein Ves